jgi:hypothetical protein
VAIVKILRELLTGIDGESHDLGRYSWMLSWFAVAGAAAANWLHGQTIPIRELAEAFGVVAAAHGAALWAKAATEPQPPEPPKE